MRIRVKGSTVVSILAHGVVLAAFVRVRHTWVAPMTVPGDVHGSRLVLSYLPGRASASANVPARAAVVKPAPATALDKVAVVPPAKVVAASTNSPVSAHPDSTAGDDALGSGNVNIALVRFFPAPKPDLSKLPRGMSGDVVVDVVIGEDGRIASMTAEKGLGYGVDEVVLATVRDWVFQPATKDGKAVASEQELHFHFEARG